MLRYLGRILAALLLVGVALTHVAGAAWAKGGADQGGSSLEQQISQLRTELEGTSAQFAEAAVTVRRTQAQLAQKQAELSQAQLRLNQLRQENQQLTARLAYAEAAEQRALDQLATELQNVQLTQQNLDRIAGAVYAQAEPSAIWVLLGSVDPAQLSAGTAFTSVTTDEQRATLARLGNQRAELQVRQTQLQTLRNQVRDLLTQSDQAVRAQRVEAARLSDLTQQQRTLLTSQQAAQHELQSQSDQERAKLGQLEAEQARIAAELAARAAAAAGRGHSSGPVRSQPGLLSYPVDGPITSGFGQRYHPILHYWRLHSGIDFGVNCGTPVRAAADGTVISAGWAGGYGNRVVIDHGWVAGSDLATTYNHLTRIVVHGGSVRRGELIAYSGTTGLSTGCHLHFETLASGVFIDPMRDL